MGLFLLGIPLALASAKMLSDDIKYTTTDLKIPKASSNLNTQYKQIEDNFIDIIKYSGAKCQIKTTGYNKYHIDNAIKGEYGGMEKYLAQKGYYPQAINYAKKMFDNYASISDRQYISERDERINKFELALLNKQSKNMILRNQVHHQMPKYVIEQKIQELTHYFNTHNNNTYCNIIINKPSNFIKHEQVWHIKIPNGENGKQYFDDVCNKLGIGW